MNLAKIVAASSIGLFSVLVASPALADGALITVKDGANVIVSRATLATFAAGSQQAFTSQGGATGVTTYTATTFSIDSVAGASGLLLMTLNGKSIGVTVTVEFTTADASGREQVTSTGTFWDVVFDASSATLDDSGFHGNYSFRFLNVSYQAAPQSKAQLRPLPPTIPIIARIAGRAPILVEGAQAAPPPTSVDAVYLALNGNQSFAKTKLKSATLSVVMPVSFAAGGAVTGRSHITLAVTQSRSAPTIVFQQAMTNATRFTTGTLSFVHTNADGSTTSQLDAALKDVAVRTDAIAMQSSSSTESTSMDLAGLNLSP